MLSTLLRQGKPACRVAFAPVALSAELIHGSWTPARECVNENVLPGILKDIEQDTKGAI